MRITEFCLRGGARGSVIRATSRQKIAAEIYPCPPLQNKKLFGTFFPMRFRTTSLENVFVN